MELSVVLPLYNAAPFVRERLPLLARYLASHFDSWELIVSDDGSTDGSIELVESLGLPGCTLLRHATNTGKYGALARGIARSRGRCVLFTDADVPYELPAIDYLSRLVLEKGFHLALGDRTLAGSRHADTAGAVRTLTGHLFRYYTRLLVTGGIYDTQCGIKAFDGEVARALFPLIRELGFTGDVELVYIALRYNLAIRRVPVRLCYQGESSIRLLRHGLAMVLSSLRIRSRHRRGDYRSARLSELARQDYGES